MSTLAERLDESVEKIEQSQEQIASDTEVLNKIVNSDENTTVTRSDGESVPSIQKVINDAIVNPANEVILAIAGLQETASASANTATQSASTSTENLEAIEAIKDEIDNSASIATDAATKAEIHDNNIIAKVEEIKDVAENGGISLTTHYNDINSRETASALGFMGYEGQDIATYPAPLNSYDLHIGFSMVVRAWIPSTKPVSTWAYNNTNIGHLWAGYIDENNHAQIYKSDDSQLHFAVTVDGVTQSKYYTGCFDIASVFYFGWDGDTLSVYCNGTELVGETSTITIATGNQSDCCTIGAIKTDSQITSNLKFNLVNFWVFNRDLGRDSNHAYATYNLTDAINGVPPPNNYRSGASDTVDWSDPTFPKTGLVSISNYDATNMDAYDLIADPDGIGGADIAEHAIKMSPSTSNSLLRISPNGMRGYTFVITGWYYATTGSATIGAAKDDSMRAGMWLEGDRTSKNQWTKFSVVASGQIGNKIGQNTGGGGQLRLGWWGALSVPVYMSNLTVTMIGTNIMIGGGNLRIPKNHNQIADASDNNNPLTIQQYITPTQPGEYGCYTEQGLIIDGRLLEGVDSENYIESVVITNTSNNTITGLDLRTSTSSTTQLFSPVNIGQGSSHIATINQSITGALYYYATSWNGAEITITFKIRKK